MGADEVFPEVNSFVVSNLLPPVLEASVDEDESVLDASVLDESSVFVVSFEASPALLAASAAYSAAFSSALILVPSLPSYTSLASVTGLVVFFLAFSVKERVFLQSAC